MSSAVGFNPQSLSPKEIQELQKQQGQSGTNVGFNVGDQAFSDFESANNKLSTNDGFTYKNSASTTTATAEKSVPYSDAEIASKEKEASGLSGQVKELDSQVNGSQAETSGKMEASRNVMTSSTDLVTGYESDIKNSGENVESLTARQEASLNLINNAGVTIEDLSAQVAQYNTEGLAMIAKAGVEGQWATVDEAVAELSQLIDPEKMEQIQEKQVEMEQNQQEIDAKTKEMEGLPDDDPKKAELQGEIDGLTAENATLEAETAELNTIEGQAITMTDLSNLMANLSEVSAAIGTLNEGIAAQQAIVTNEQQAAQSVNNEVQTESKNVATAKSKTMNEATKIDKANGDNNDDANEGMTVAQGFGVAADIGVGVSTGVETVGSALIATGNPATMGTGIIMENCGRWGKVGFEAVGFGADTYEIATNDDLSLGEKFAQIGQGAVKLVGSAAMATVGQIGQADKVMGNLSDSAKDALKAGDTSAFGKGGGTVMKLVGGKL